MTSLQAEITGVQAFCNNLSLEIEDKCIKRGLTEACKVIESDYRRLLASVSTKPGNSGVRAASPGSIGSKVSRFKDGTGYYGLVGAMLKNGRLLSPQTLWGEIGTAERHTKSGANRGSMPAQHWLAKALDNSRAFAQDVLEKRVTYLVSRIGTSNSS